MHYFLPLTNSLWGISPLSLEMLSQAQQQDQFTGIPFWVWLLVALLVIIFAVVWTLHKEEELEEELRLMYVAATRAQENLFFTYPSNVYDRSTGLVLNQPSRYIDGIPDHILKKQFEYR